MASERNSWHMLPWQAPLAIAAWYVLYGWGLAIGKSPLLEWAIAAAISAFLAAAIQVALLLAVPATLAAAWAVGTRLTLNAIVLKGSGRWIGYANIVYGNGWLFFALGLLIAAFWFATLLFPRLQLERHRWERKQAFWVMAGASWLGIALGWGLGMLRP